MMTKISIFVLVVINNIAFSQNAIPNSILNKCNTAKKINYLTEDEK